MKLIINAVLALIVLAILVPLAAMAKVDPTGPIPIGTCIRHDDMLARMKAQHGATIIETGALPDGRMLETYYDPVNHLWFQTIVKRTKTASGWSIYVTSPTCFFADSDPVAIPE